MQCKVIESLNLNEKKKLQKFLTNHYCPDVRDNYNISFSPSSIGVAVFVTCKLCDEKHDITDYGAW